MFRYRSSQRRSVQVLAWLAFCISIAVVIVGMIVGPGQLSMAQDGDTQVEKPADTPPAEGQPEAKPEDAKPQITLRQIGKDESSTIGSKAISFLGIFFFIFLAWVLSNNRKKVNWRLVGVGVSLQLTFAVLILVVPGGRYVFDVATKVVNELLDFTNQGSSFIFSSFVTHQWEPALINFSFAVLPTIIFFSSLMSILYHVGLMHWVVGLFAKVMQKAMNTSGAESLSAAANIFVGQTEAPLVIKPYVNDMTMSELMTVMTGGFATVAGGVLAIYVGMLQPMFPDIAGHLIAASVMSAPAALVVGKIMWPETETPMTGANTKMEHVKEDINILDAASRGAAEGLMLALNVGAMLLAFIALIALVNALIALPQGLIIDTPYTLQQILGFFFAPIAWIMGVPWEDCRDIGRLLGVKMAINELVAYAELQVMLSDATRIKPLADRSVIIATYALCGFANFGSIGIQLGGIGGIAPKRKQDLAVIAFRAMIAGTIAAFMTATIAGILV